MEVTERKNREEEEEDGSDFVQRAREDKQKKSWQRQKEAQGDEEE